jgi:hypothetical protein
MRNEGRIVKLACIVLIALNLISVFFILDLLACDEIVKYLDDGGIKSSSPRHYSFALLLTSMINIVFVLTALLARYLPK